MLPVSDGQLSIRDNSAFFTMLSNKDIWVELRKHMYPGKKTANFYEYKNGNMAAYHGYFGLILESKNIEFNDECVIESVESGNLELFKYLCEHYFKEWVTGWVIFNAARSKRLDFVQHLKTKGTLNYEHELTVCIKFADFEFVKFVCENFIGQVTYEPLNTALKQGNLDIVTYLLEKGYKCNKQGLYYAASNGHFTLVKLLFDNKLIRTKRHIKRAEMYAIANQHTNIADYLSDKYHTF